jgi:hypothetical protein
MAGIYAIGDFSVTEFSQAQRGRRNPLCTNQINVWLCPTKSAVAADLCFLGLRGGARITLL